MKKLLPWVLRIVAAVILLWTLFFKFGGHPDSVQLFTDLGVEPYGRIGIGVLEMIASILLLLSATVGWGAVLAFGLMSGAIASHFTVLGFADGRDGLFGMAVVVWVCSVVLLWFYRKTLPVLKNL